MWEMWVIHYFHQNNILLSNYFGVSVAITLILTSEEPYRILGLALGKTSHKLKYVNSMLNCAEKGWFLLQIGNWWWINHQITIQFWPITEYWKVIESCLFCVYILMTETPMSVELAYAPHVDSFINCNMGYFSYLVTICLKSNHLSECDIRLWITLVKLNGNKT